ncbi:MAG: thiamine pyrophosphate-binding protein [Gemmatimonadales bacterium]
MTSLRTGAQAFVDALEEEGVTCVFGLPGTQTVDLYEALRHSSIRAIVPTHELGAAFMAYGFARASGQVGVLLTIPGPGFVFAPAGLAEALLDGVPVVHFTLAPSRGPTGDLAFQALDQMAIARPLVKAVFRVERRADLSGIVREALRTARQPEAGPVFVEMTDDALRATDEPAVDAPSRAASGEAAVTPAGSLDALIARMTLAKRPAILVAADCAASGERLERLASTGRVPVFVPAPSRGVMPEDHPWLLCCDDQRTRREAVTSALASADVIVVLGTRLTHVATGHFKLALPAERVVCVSESGAELPHGYRASATLHASVDAVLARLESAASTFASTWTVTEAGELRREFAGAARTEQTEPVVNGGDAATFFSELRSVLPRDAIVVTDSGLHQALVRRHFTVLGPGGLLFPTELQSMAFGLPVAMGAKIARPDRVVVVVMGDGGFAMSGMELLTAARDGIHVIVVVFNDGKLNLIRLQQLRAYGVSHGTDLQELDLERFAQAAGVGYRYAGDGAVGALTEAIGCGRPTIVEVVVGDSRRISLGAARSYAKESVRRTVGPGVFGLLKRWFG